MLGAPDGRAGSPEGFVGGVQPQNRCKCLVKCWNLENIIAVMSENARHHDVLNPTGLRIRPLAPRPQRLAFISNDTILQLACWLAPAQTHWEWQGANNKVGQCCMSCSLVNINHLVFSVPAYMPSSEKRNCLVESKMEGDNGHGCVSLFPSMSENQSCKQQSNKAFNCPQPLFNEQLFETKWPVCTALSLMTQLAFHARRDSENIYSNNNRNIWWDENQTVGGMRLKGDSNLVRLLHFLQYVESIFFYHSIVFIISLPVPSESICGQSLGKENASIWFLRLYNL